VITVEFSNHFNVNQSIAATPYESAVSVSSPDCYFHKYLWNQLDPIILKMNYLKICKHHSLKQLQHRLPLPTKNTNTETAGI